MPGERAYVPVCCADAAPAPTTLSVAAAPATARPVTTRRASERVERRVLVWLMDMVFPSDFGSGPLVGRAMQGRYGRSTLTLDATIRSDRARFPPGRRS